MLSFLKYIFICIFFMPRSNVSCEEPLLETFVEFLPLPVGLGPKISQFLQRKTVS